MTPRLSPAEMRTCLGLTTDRPLVAARAVRTPDGRWWLACRGLGLKDHEAPSGWIAPFESATRDDAAELEAEQGRRPAGRGWALDWL